MNPMESAHWRSYRRHLIIARKTFIGLRRYDVWRRGQLLATCRTVVEAELHVDGVLEQQAESEDGPDPSARELLASLTAQERALLEAIAQGRSSKEIARELGLSTKEVQAARQDLFGKIGAGSTADALRVARYGGMPEQQSA
jgi:DNA-binding NarL/FixJ family response regulator